DKDSAVRGVRVECVEEKQVAGWESAARAAGNEKQASVERALVVVDLTGDPNRGDGDNGGEEKHEQTQTIDAEREMNLPVRRNKKRADKLKTGCDSIESAEKSQGHKQI